MTVVAGIDEAGLGPVLGPMVMSLVAVEVPDERADVSLWQQLSGTVARRPSTRRSCVAIADSKTLYHGLHGREGLVHLERGVLTMLRVMGHAPASLAELLALLSPPALTAAGAYPWYRDLDLELPRTVARSEIEDSAERLARRMRRAEVRLLAVRSETVFARELNDLIDDCGNKGGMHFTVATRLLEAARTLAPGRELVVHVDRHGGRKRYHPPLQRLWPASWIWIVDESDHHSSYEVRVGDHRFDVHFTVGCEDRQLPVALASMASKYLRELLMDRFNAFWASRLEELAPTAGYYRDGHRFYREIQHLLPVLGLHPDAIFRRR